MIGTSGSEPPSEGRSDALELFVGAAVVMPAESLDLFKQFDAGEILSNFVEEVGIDLGIEGIPGHSLEVAEDVLVGVIGHGSSRAQIVFEAV